MRTLALLALAVFLFEPLSANRPKETTADAIAATDELARFADQHSAISFYDARRVPFESDQPWTVELYHDAETPPHETQPRQVIWSESNYSHLLDAVVAVERDFTVHPEGFTGKCERDCD